MLLVAMAIVAGMVAARAHTFTWDDAQPGPPSAKEVRGASPYLEIENEPPPKLIVQGHGLLAYGIHCFPRRDLRSGQPQIAPVIAKRAKASAAMPERAPGPNSCNAKFGSPLSTTCITGYIGSAARSTHPSRATVNCRPRSKR
jgi:hypothetical protein